MSGNRTSEGIFPITDRLLSGQTLVSGQYLVSPNRVFILRFRRVQGGLVLHQAHEGEIWNSGGESQRGRTDKVRMTDDGKVGFCDYQNAYISWLYEGPETDKSAALIVQDDGNVVLKTNSKKIWSSNTSRKPAKAGAPPAIVGRIYPGEPINKQTIWLSPNGQYTLCFKTEDDGEVLVMLNNLTGSRQIVGPPNMGGRFRPGMYELSATLREDGQFVVLYNETLEIWSSGSAHRGGDKNSYLEVRDDGTVGINADGVIIWDTKAENITMKENPSPTKRGITNNMLIGEALYPNESLVSTNGLFSLTLGSRTKLSLYQKDLPSMWSRGGGDRSSKFLAFQYDGNLVLYDTWPTACWSSDTMGKCNKKSVLTLKDDGDLVITTDGQTVWTSGSAKDVFVPSHELRVGQELSNGRYLESKNKEYRFITQTDGQAVCYRGSNPYWVIPFRPGTRGWLVLRVTDRDEILYGNWSSKTCRRKSGGNAVLTLRDDGNLVLISDGTIIWCGNNPGFVPAKFPANFSPTPNDRNTLEPGTYLSRGQALTSNNKLWTAKFESDGKFILYRKFYKNNDPNRPALEKVLTPEFSDKGAHYIYMLYDGIFTCFGANAEKVWENDYWGADAFEGTLLLGDDGHLLCGRQYSSGTWYPASGHLNLSMIRPGERICKHDFLVSDDRVYSLYVEKEKGITIYKNGSFNHSRNLDGSSSPSLGLIWISPTEDHRALTIDDKGSPIIYGPENQVICKVEAREYCKSNSWQDEKRMRRREAMRREDIKPVRLVMERDGVARIWNEYSEEVANLSGSVNLTYDFGDTRTRT